MLVQCTDGSIWVFGEKATYFDPNAQRYNISKLFTQQGIDIQFVGKTWLAGPTGLWIIYGRDAQGTFRGSDIHLRIWEWKGNANKQTYTKWHFARVPYFENSEGVFQTLSFAVEEPYYSLVWKGRSVKSIQGFMDEYVFASVAILDNDQVWAREVAETVFSGDLGTDWTHLKYFDKLQPLMVAAGCDHSIILDSNQQVWTFGSHEVGQLGLGDVDLTASSAPVLVQSLCSIVQIYAGGYSNYVKDQRDRVFVFGSNEFGQLALKTNWTGNRSVPIENPDLLGHSVYPGLDFLVSIDKKGTVFYYAKLNEVHKFKLKVKPSEPPLVRLANTKSANVRE